MTSPILAIFVWWLIMQVLGWLALPTAMRIFRWLPDRGYAFSKALGLLLITYLLWLGGSLGFLRNNLSGILVSALAVAGISAWFYFRGDGLDLGAFLRRHARMIIVVEVLFLAAFALWATLRGYATFKIDSAGGEKFMEIAFLNAVLRSESFPPLDPWLSGFGISYYYFGYVMMALLTRLSGVASGIGFDLYDALLLALAALGAFGVVYNLAAAHRQKAAPEHASGSHVAAGLLGSLLVVFMGNLQGVWESLHARGILPESFWQWLAIPDLASAPVTGSWVPGQSGWLWWWRASRVLNDTNLAGQPLGIQPISEFPLFSFLLGDNHPHVLALPFVLLAIGLALNLLRRQVLAGPGPALEVDTPAAPWWNPPAYALGNDWVLGIFSALIIGALGFLNTWDMPIYWGLALLAYAAGGVLVQGRLGWPLLKQTVSLGVGLALGSALFYGLFFLSFDSQASGILPYVFPPTRLPQYLTIFGTFVVILALFLGSLLVRQERQRAGALRLAGSWWLRLVLTCAAVFLLILLLIGSAVLIRPELLQNSLLQYITGGVEMGVADALLLSLQARLRNPWMLLLVTGLMAAAIAGIRGLLRNTDGAAPDETPEPAARLDRVPEAFVFLLIFTGLALTLVVEFIYLRDSFNLRMNTVFKFYYQAWVMLGCASAYAVWWLLNRLEGRVGRSLAAGGALLVIVLGLVYTVMGIHSRANGFSGDFNLDGASNIARAHPEDWSAIQWLNENAVPAADGSAPVILEAPGESYDYEGRISAFSGYPAVLGWAVHESQWRGDYEEQGKRQPDIATIYTTSDGEAMLALLRKWNVRYVILGNVEWEYIRRLCANDSTLTCNPTAALRKFDLFLEPVFTGGTTRIYQVP